MALDSMVRLLFSTALAKMAKVPLSVQTRRQYPHKPFRRHASTQFQWQTPHRRCFYSVILVEEGLDRPIDRVISFVLLVTVANVVHHVMVKKIAKRLVGDGCRRDVGATHKLMLTARFSVAAAASSVLSLCKSALRRIGPND
jgi:hypothetical protein